MACLLQHTLAAYLTDILNTTAWLPCCSDDSNWLGVPSFPFSPSMVARRFQVQFGLAHQTAIFLQKSQPPKNSTLIKSIKPNLGVSLCLFIKEMELKLPPLMESQLPTIIFHVDVWINGRTWPRALQPWNLIPVIGNCYNFCSRVLRDVEAFVSRG